MMKMDDDDDDTEERVDDDGEDCGDLKREREI